MGLLLSGGKRRGERKGREEKGQKEGKEKSGEGREKERRGKLKDDLHLTRLLASAVIATVGKHVFCSCAAKQALVVVARVISRATIHTARRDLILQNCRVV